LLKNPSADTANKAELILKTEITNVEGYINFNQKEIAQVTAIEAKIQTSA